MEWIRITISTGKVFSCPVHGWLDNDSSDPSSRTVSCISSGNIVTFHSGGMVESNVYQKIFLAIPSSWASWGSWGTCSKTCGGGVRYFQTLSFALKLSFT